MPEVLLRDSQTRILDYSGGLMGISAVPGSGKTWTLSQLAAKLILTVDLAPDQEILVVTFSNSAADNFSTRIGSLLRQSGLLAGLGYRVRTLHGLANDIIHERPDLAGLTNDFVIVDQEEADDIRSNIVDTWLRLNPDFFDDLLSDTLNPKKLDKIRKDELPKLVKKLAEAFIGTAKDLRLTNDDLNQLLEKRFDVSPLLRLGQSIYTDYQAALNYRGAVDFDDLIRLAYQCLTSDPDLASQLHHRWPYILEDEAQDSSKLQEEILRLLVEPDGNWVRVGDPNQAIYESFTTANPNLLKNYLVQPCVRSEDLPESGRSSMRIMQLANHMNMWVQKEHPNLTVRDALSPPYIQPTKPGDPQPNPPDQINSVELIHHRMTPDEELQFIVKEVGKWLRENPDKTVAVLAYVNRRVSDIADALKASKIPVVDALMNLPETTRLSAGAITYILYCISQPLSSHYLSKAFQVWKRKERDDDLQEQVLNSCTEVLTQCKKPEEYLYPQDGNDWLVNLQEVGTSAPVLEELVQFKDILQKWHLAAILPPDQLILTVANDLDLDPFELATVHKLALLVKDLQETHSDWSLVELTGELKGIAKNDRRFFNFSESDAGFDPEQHKGEVVVATMHKSKGLEWDKVFITSVNNYDYPSGADDDEYYSEKYYLKNRLNLEAETLAQLHALVEDSMTPDFRSGSKALEARNEVIRERLRLLYVGITRARCSVTISWNTGRPNKYTEALALHALDLKLYESKNEQLAA
ncbi:MAG: ATP-dependent helicase [Anaerolineaceae bacterium]